MQKSGSKFCLGGDLTELIILRRQKYGQTHENYLIGLIHLNSAVDVEKSWSWEDYMGCCLRGQGKNMNLEGNKKVKGEKYMYTLERNCLWVLDYRRNSVKCCIKYTGPELKSQFYRNKVCRSQIRRI